MAVLFFLICHEILLVSHGMEDRLRLNHFWRLSMNLAAFPPTVTSPGGITRAMRSGNSLRLVFPPLTAWQQQHPMAMQLSQAALPRTSNIGLNLLILIRYQLITHRTIIDDIAELNCRKNRLQEATWHLWNNSALKTPLTCYNKKYRNGGQTCFLRFAY